MRDADGDVALHQVLLVKHAERGFCACVSLIDADGFELRHLKRLSFRLRRG